MSDSRKTVPTARVNIPAALRPFTDEQRVVDVPGRTVGQVLEGLAARYPRLGPHLFDEAGGVRSFVSIYLGDEDVRHLQNQQTRVSADAEVSIVPSIAGGSGR